MFRFAVLIVSAAVASACIIHYLLTLLVFGSRKVAPAAGRPRIRRFRVWERAVHLATMVGFLALVVTGFAASVWFEAALSGWWWVAHLIAAAVFTLGVTALVLTWALDCRFAPHDVEWARHFGGYLGGSAEVPAGRFNCGQKGLFWTVLVLGLGVVASGLLRIWPVFDAEGQELVLLAHQYCALAYLALGIAHLYLGTIANPGTWQSIFFGYVDANWLKHHHPLWYGQEENEARRG
ncbi:MAG: cytochrome b/b6 domain-containing protein [Candidatus Hydrogenedentes bacterium]|nr:cytochrome b/b6 domain-containing protein [Candidatus Hydrogenedentota bacterium]